MTKKAKKIDQPPVVEVIPVCPECGNKGENHELCCPNNTKTLSQWLESYEPVGLPTIEGLDISKEKLKEELTNKLNLSEETKIALNKTIENIKITTAMSNDDIANYLIQFLQPYLVVGSMELSVLDEAVFRLLNPPQDKNTNN